MDNNVSVLDGGPVSDQLQRVGLGSHAKLERQGSKGSRGCPTPSRQVATPLGNRVDSEKQSDDLHGLLSIVSRGRRFASFNDCITSAGTLISWLVLHHTRTLGSNHGGRSQNGGLGQRRTITPLWQRGVASRTKEASGAPSRSCSKRSKDRAAHKADSPEKLQR